MELEERVRLRLAEEVSRQGLTRTALAKRMGCSTMQVSNLLSGNRKLSLTWLEKLCNALSVHPATLVAAVAPLGTNETGHPVVERLARLVRTGWAEEIEIALEPLSRVHSEAERRLAKVVDKLHTRAAILVWPVGSPLKAVASGASDEEIDAALGQNLGWERFVREPFTLLISGDAPKGSQWIENLLSWAIDMWQLRLL